MAGERVRGGEVQQKESFNDRCARLIPGYHGYEESLIISAGRRAISGITPDVASYFAHGLIRSALDGTAQYGVVDPESAQGQELAVFLAELAPAAEAAAAHWAQQAQA